MGRWFLVSMAVLGGCAAKGDDEDDYDKDEFAEDFGELYCDMIVECGGEPCATTATGTTTSTGTAQCDFDEDAGRACIDGEWECSDEVGGFSFPIPPDVCAEVCGDLGGSTTSTYSY